MTLVGALIGVSLVSSMLLLGPSVLAGATSVNDRRVSGESSSVSVVAPGPSLAAAPDPTGSPAPASLIIGVRQRGSLDALGSRIAAIQQASGAGIGVSLIELGGFEPQAWSLNGDEQFVAASTYKLPVLMAEAQLVAARPSAANDQLCYVDADSEDGWYQDYYGGTCFTRATLSLRVGQNSDNTAGHILVRYLGGTDALNAYARAHGASESGFYVPNVTTANDLARLMADEARGNAGGGAAQAWIYQLLTHTSFENGLPAGVGPGATVLHKIGTIDTVSNDVGLIQGSPNGPYVLAVCTTGLEGDAGMALVAKVSAAVWQFESGER